MSNAELILRLKSMIQEKKWNLFRDIIQHRTRYLTVVMENVEQQHNLSAVIRSCDCFGLQDVHVIGENYQESINPKVEKGAAQWTSIYSYPSTQQCFQELKKKGYKILVTSPKAKRFIHEIPVEQQKIALVFGNEIKGVSANAIAQADELVKIPMFGFTESYNISVSAALCMQHFVNEIHNKVHNYNLSQQEQEEVLIAWMQNIIKNGEKVVTELKNRSTNR
jgi:tRNA (guanosine-2'-O-)-methyltransferase